MVSLPVYFDVGGYWTELETCWVWCGAQSEIRGIMLEEESSKFNMLVDKICRKARIDKKKQSLKITYMPERCPKMKPIQIFDDDDLLVFLGLLKYNNMITLLHVQVEDNENNYVEQEMVGAEEIASFPNNAVEIQKSPPHDEYIDCDFVVDQDEIGYLPIVTAVQPLVISDERETACLLPRPDLPSGEPPSFQRYTFDDGSDLQVNDHFKSKKELKKKLYVIALKGKFEFKTIKSNKSLLVVACVDTNCKWRVRACKLSVSNIFFIRKYYRIHSCSLEKRSSKHRQATYSVIGDCMKSQFVGIEQGPRPRSIQSYVRSEFGTDFSYYKGWMARGHAIDLIRGTAEESYAMLPSYFHMLKYVNPGTVTHIEMDDDNRFKCLFVAHGPCIRGFVCMRKVIGVDGTWLKGKFRGTLLVATAQDSECSCYPIAWGIVKDSETDEAWIWFFSKLNEIVKDSDDLVFISDRNQSIKKAVSTVYKLAHHGCCIYHVEQNIKSHFHSSGALNLFYKAANAYRIENFYSFFEELCTDYPSVGRYLQEQVGFEKWSRAHFKGNRYNIMTTSMVESLNGMLKEVRDYPVVALLDYILGKMSMWFNDRRTNAAATTSTLTPEKEKTLHERYNKAGYLTTNKLNVDEYHVVGGEISATVNLRLKSCTCRVFDIDQLPCEHAIAACGEANISIYDLSSHYYRTDTLVQAYAETIYPVPDHSQWHIPDDVKKVCVLAPNVKPRRGRPKQKRFPSAGEFTRRRNRCALCKQYGHYQKKCINAPVS